MTEIERVQMTATTALQALKLLIPDLYDGEPSGLNRDELEAIIAAEEADRETRIAVDTACLEWAMFWEEGDNPFNAPCDVGGAAIARGLFLASRGDG